MGELFSKLKAVLSEFTGSDPTKIFLDGLDASGKTSILYRLKLNETVSTIPTIGFNVETVKPCKGVSLTVWDVGGGEKIRALRKHYYQNTDGLIYIIDSTDRERMAEAREELFKILDNDELRHIPIIVVANKQDLPNCRQDVSVLIPDAAGDRTTSICLRNTDMPNRITDCRQDVSVLIPDAAGDRTTSICFRNTDMPNRNTDSQDPNYQISDADGNSPMKKNTITSEHSYTCKKRSISFDDHVYACALHGEDDLDDEEEIEDQKDFKKDLLKLLPKIQQCSNYEIPSVLKKSTIKDLTEKDIYLHTLEEMNERCPDLLQMMTNTAVADETKITLRQVMAIITAYSILMFARSNKNSAFQRILTLLAVKGDANDEFLREMNHLCLTLSCSGKLYLLDSAGKTTEKLLIEAVADNPKIKIDLENIREADFLLNEMESDKMRSVKKVLLGRALSEKEEFSWLKDVLPKHIPHRYSENMSKKSKVFGLPVIFKNESKNEDCLQIMQEYETQLIKIFNEAYGDTEKLDLNYVVLGGDMLTRERLQNVKNIRELAPTIEGRFGHLHPIVCELWHIKQDLLSKAYKALYNKDSVSEKGSLAHCKVILRRSDVNGNVKSNYKAHEDLLLIMVQALVHVASESLQNDQNRDMILGHLYATVHGEQYGNEDGMLNYFSNLMIWGIQIMNMTDTAKEGDMERLLYNCKENIKFFYGHSKHSKYFTEVVNFLLVVNYLVSSQMKVRVLEGAFINSKGGTGNNKEADLVQENSIRNKKDLIRNLGANKTEKAVSRACSAADTCSLVQKNFYRQIGLKKLSQNHTKKSSSKDLQILVKLFREIQPFKYIKGRKMKYFEKIPKDPRKKVCTPELLDAIKKKISRLYLNS